jgi:integrase
MAFIRKRGNSYKVEIRKKGHPHINKSFIDLKTARRFARDIESQMERNVFEDYSVASGTTLKDILIKYRDEKTSIKKGSREETSIINFLIKHQISMQTLMRLRSHHIYKLMRELGKTRAPATVKKYVVLICHAWRVAKKEWGINLPPENPCDMVTLPKVNDARDRILSKSEYTSLLESCRNSHLNILEDIVVFAYSTGARQGEILRLAQDNIDYEKKLITFLDTKNGLDRTIPAADNVLKILRKYRFGKKVFNIVARRLRKHFKIACVKAGINNFRFHDLRACFCTNALLNGWSIAEVSTVSGHKDWSQLKRYTRIKPADLLDKINNVNVIKLSS